MPEFLRLLWLRARRARSAAGYWLTVFGYESGESFGEKAYGFYAILVLVFLLLFSWGGALQIASQIGRALPPDVRTGLAAVLPLLVAFLQIVAMAIAAASGPLKLTFPEMAYVSGARVSRRAVVAAVFAGKAVVALIASAALGSLVGTFLLGSAERDLVAAWVALPIGLLTLALAWLVGVVGQALRPRGRSHLVAWLGPIAGLALLVGAPLVAGWPGSVWVAALRGEGVGAQAVAMAAIALALSLIVVALGRGVNLTWVNDASRRYARLAEIPSMLAFTQPALVQQIRTEVAAATRRFGVRLPQVEGPLAVVVRVAFTFWRQPTRWFDLASDVGVTLGGCWVLALGGGGRPWLTWLMAVVIIRPRSLCGGFAVDGGDGFLRQFLPHNERTILLLNAALPGVAATALSLAIWALVAPVGPALWLGLAFAPALIALRIACEGLASAAPVQAQAFRLPYYGYSAIGFGLLAALGVLARLPVLALLVACALVWTAAQLLGRTQGEGD